MNRSDQIRILFAELRRLHPEVPAGDLVRIVWFILKANEEADQDEGYDGRSRTPTSYSLPVDVALADGGWANMVVDKRSARGPWDDERDPADDTAARLKKN